MVARVNQRAAGDLVSPLVEADPLLLVKGGGYQVRLKSRIMGFCLIL
jgi:hypothetical protein